MEQLRSRALGEGWRKLVADGIVATPVALKRGPSVFNEARIMAIQAGGSDPARINRALAPPELESEGGRAEDWHGRRRDASDSRAPAQVG